MDKYIKYEDIQECRFFQDERGEWILHADIIKIPAADVVPVRHGRWTRVDDGIYYHMECSLCHERPLRNRWVNDNELSLYCPNCGARMDMITDSNQVKDGDGQ